MAARLGAWAVGLIRYRESPRYCSLEDAVAVGTVLKRKCEIVGVYVNAKLDEIASDVEQIGLSMVQLHGDEGPSYCIEVQRRTGAKVIKALRVKDRSSLATLKTYKVDFYMLDAYSEKVRGGTGERFDWALAADLGTTSPLILSGGLNADNVVEGMAAVQPYAVDVASGVELEPGRKDPSKVEEFFEAVQGAPANETGNNDQTMEVNDEQG